MNMGKNSKLKRTITLKYNLQNNAPCFTTVPCMYSKSGVDILNTFRVKGYMKIFARRQCQCQWWISNHNSSILFFRNRQPKNYMVINVWVNYISQNINYSFKEIKCVVDKRTFNLPSSLLSSSNKISCINSGGVLNKILEIKCNICKM